MQICGGLDVKCFRLLKCSFHVRFGFHRKKHINNNNNNKKNVCRKGEAKSAWLYSTF